MIPKVQICGIMNLEDAEVCTALGADSLGFVNVEGRSRYLTLDSIKLITDNLKPYISKTLISFRKEPKEIIERGDYVNADSIQLYSINTKKIEKIRNAGFKVINTIGIDILDPNNNINTNRIKKMEKIADLVLLEPSVEGKIGGTGTDFDYEKKLSSISKEINYFGIGGGLTPKNVNQALRLNPYSVHVSSGIESQMGKKERKKTRDFIRKVKM